VWVPYVLLVHMSAVTFSLAFTATVVKKLLAHGCLNLQPLVSFVFSATLV